MKTSNTIRQGLLAGACALLLICAPVGADEAQPTPGCMTDSGRGFDWIQHTRHTLDELKGKLNLAAGQMPAWETWSGGVIKDAHQQVESGKDAREEQREKAKPQADATTPEQMTRGIKRLHAEIDRMQQHVVQLEAAQVRTSTFYDALDVNQRTIFDLFWHEMYHRSSGHDEGCGMDGHEGFGAARMMGSHEGPAGDAGSN